MGNTGIRVSIPLLKMSGKHSAFPNIGLMTMFNNRVHDDNVFSQPIRVLLFVTLTVIISITITAAVIASYKGEKRSLIDTTETLLSSINGSLINSLKVGDYTEVERLLGGVAKDKRVSSIVLVDSNLYLDYAYPETGSLYKKIIREDLLDRIFKSTKLSDRQSYFTKGSDLIFYKLLADERSSKQWHLLVNFSLGVLKYQIFRKLLGLIFVVFAFTVAAYLFLTKVISKKLEPLSITIAQIKEISIGNYVLPEILLPKVPQLKSFVTAFNEMKTNLNNLRAKEKKQTEALKEQSNLVAIGQSTAMVAHDVRKPFSLIKSVLEAFDEYKNNPKDLEQAKIGIDRSIRHVEAMLSDIMDFSRDVKLEVEPRSLVDLIDFSVRQVVQGHCDRNIEFEYRLNHKMKPYLDDERMARVLANIIGNGIEAIFNMGKKESGKIWIETESLALETVIIIGNDGPRFNEDDLPKLFDSFFTKGKKKGTGLGLASSQKIVTQHGGEIAARNCDRGVEFVITLPSSDRLENGDPNKPPRSIKEAVFTEAGRGEEEIHAILKRLQRGGHTYKVLLLEDEALYRASVRNTIKDEVLSKILTLYDAHTVEDGLKLLEKEGISHAIVDVDLGGMRDGYNFLEVVQKRYPQLKCMVHSNRCLSDDRERSRALGANWFVPKPLMLGHLVLFLEGSEQSASKAVTTRAVEIAGPVPQMSVVAGPIYSPLDSVPPIEREIEIRPANLQKKKLLLVNDDRDLLMSYKFSLKEADLHLTTASNVEEAEEKLSTLKFDIVISDINLGKDEPDGYELLKKVRARDKDIPFYMMSGNSVGCEAARAKELGATGYLQMPIVAEQIVALV